MIPKEAFIALAALMASAWVFGIVCDRLLVRWIQWHKKNPDVPDRHSCDTCKHQMVRPTDEPCCDCVNGDIDRWEES